MKLVYRKKFLKYFNRFKKKEHLKTSQVAKNAGLSQSYTYRLVSPKNKDKSMLESTAKKLCDGLKISLAQERKIISACEEKREKHGLNIQNYVIKTMRERNLTTNKLATQSGLNDHRLKDFLNGKSEFSKVSLVKLARGLHVDPVVLLSPTATQDEPSKPEQKPRPAEKQNTSTADKNKESADNKKENKTKTAPTVKPTADTAKKPDNDKPYRKLTLRPDVMELAKYINEHLNASDIAVLRLLAEKMKH